MFLCQALAYTGAIAQAQAPEVFVVRPTPDDFRIHGMANGCLKFNGLTTDSLIRHVWDILDERLAIAFDTVRVARWTDLSGLPADSLYESKDWNCFYYDDSSRAYQPLKSRASANSYSYHNIFIGKKLAPEGMKVLNQAFSGGSADFLLVVTRFEIIGPNSIFSMHCELYDRSMRLLFGGKNELRRSVSRHMLAGVMDYYCRLAIDDMLSRLKAVMR